MLVVPAWTGMARNEMLMLNEDGNAIHSALEFSSSLPHHRLA